MPAQRKHYSVRSYRIFRPRQVLPEDSGTTATAGRELAPVPHGPMQSAGEAKTVAFRPVNLTATAASAARPGNH
jgi:hypothetical protein